MFTKTRYKIHPKYATVVHSPDRVEFRSGIWNVSSIFVEDQEEKGFLASVIRSLDGTSTSSELAKKFDLSISQIEGIIDHLHHLKLLDEAKISSIKSFFSDYMPFFPPHIEADIEKPVLLMGDREFIAPLKNELGKLISQELMTEIPTNNELYQKIKNIKFEEWQLSGLDYFSKINEFKDLKNYFVVLAFTHIDPIFSKNFNRIAYELGIHWIHLAVDGPFLLIGPTFIGGESPCYECLETRILMNLRERHSYQNYKNALTRDQVIHPTAQLNPLVLSLMISHASIEIINFLASGYTFTLRKLLGIYLPTMEISFNELLPLSTCHQCGPVKNRTDSQLYFDMQTQLALSSNP